MLLLSVIALALVGLSLALIGRAVFINRVRTLGQVSAIDAYGFDVAPSAPAASTAGRPRSSTSPPGSVPAPGGSSTGCTRSPRAPT